MDVSSSLTERDRQLTNTSFIWVVQGLRRQYVHVEPVFVAHTVEAWEFAESQCFEVRAPVAQWRRRSAAAGVVR